MRAKEILKHYRENGGLRCKNWSLDEIKQEVKSTFGKEQVVSRQLCFLLKREAEIFQR
jgi:hypothetical protein